jgi:hypothetical protein
MRFLDLMSTVSLFSLAFAYGTSPNAFTIRPHEASIRHARFQGTRPIPLRFRPLMRLRGSGNDEDEAEELLQKLKISGDEEGATMRNYSRNVNIVFIGHVDSGMALKKNDWASTCLTYL